MSDAERTVLADPLPPVERVGRYRLCAQLGSGGMATVWLARQDGVHGAQRFVALKRTHGNLKGDRVFAELFRDEARIASMLQHPHVCSVLDYDMDEHGGYYLVMEYLLGEPLGTVQRLLGKRKHRVEHEWSILGRLVADAAEGLHAAHELRDEDGQPLSVVHRDVSLDNIYVTYDGVVKLIDFGVVKATDQLHRTSTGIVMGKRAYVAPETLKGKRPDRRVDVWALGTVLWELLTGERLFRRANEIETLRAVLESRVPPPSSLRPGLPQDFDRVTLRALARDPAHRYPTARDFGRDLMRVAMRHGPYPGFADIAEWMAHLFPNRQDERRAFLARAAAHVRRDEGSVAPSGDRLAEPADDAPEIVITTDEPAPSADPPPQLAPTTQIPFVEEPDRTPTWMWRAHRTVAERRRWIALGACISVLLVSAGVWSLTRAAEPPIEVTPPIASDAYALELIDGSGRRVPVRLVPIEREAAPEAEPPAGAPLLCATP